VLPKGVINTMPASAQARARQHGVSTLDAITDAFTTVAATRHGVPFVRPTIEPTNTMTLYGRRIPHVASHVFLNLMRTLKKQTMRKSDWYAVTPLRVGGGHGAHCGAMGDVGPSLPTLCLSLSQPRRATRCQNSGWRRSHQASR
jgi:hypothetical protein